MRLPPVPELDATQDPWLRLARDDAPATGRAERPPRGLSGLPRVLDTSVGARTTWRASFAWEGDELLAALREVRAAAGGALSITAYLSESRAVREALTEQVRALARERGWSAAVRVRSAYKPGYHWACEEVLPLAAALRADTLRLTYPVLPPEPAGRFLHETYPLVAQAERYGLGFEASADAALGATYRAQLLRGGLPVHEATCRLPLAERRAPDGETVLAPTGRVCVRDASTTLLEQRILTDGERVWDWYLHEVLPQVLGSTAFTPGQPGFRTLSVTLEVSEPDELLGVGHERSSMTEALAEEVYFGTLDALKLHAGHDLDARSLQPGRIVPVVHAREGRGARARVVLTAARAAARDGAVVVDAPGAPDLIEPRAVPLPQGPARPVDVWANARQLADTHGLRWHLPAYSYDGRPVPVAVRSGGRGGLLVTAGQHANEASGPVAALRLLDELARQSTLDFAVAPLENPDGAALHLALARTAPQHMHHAARYTSLGDDLEARVARADARWEARARVWAAHTLRPRLHLSLHGYPSHEWTRPFSGYAPRGFEAWAIPAGFLTIIRHAAGHAAAARALAGEIARQLRADEVIDASTRDALRWSAAHVAGRHYELVLGMPFIFQERTALLAPLVVITEVPDETVYGEAFETCVRAHTLVGRACVAFLT